MNEAFMIELSQEELQGLIELIDDTIERKLAGIKERILADYFIETRYDKPEVWEAIKAQIEELVKSDLALIRSRFAGFLKALPVEPVEVEAPVVEKEGEPEPEPKPEPKPEKAKARFGEREL